MLGRYWGFVFVCLALAASNALSQEQGQSSASSAASQSQTEPAVEPSAAVLSDPSGADPGAGSSESDDAPQDQQQPSPKPTDFWPQFTPSDTYAQWIVAALSVLGTGVSIWAVVLLRGTLRVNRDATRAAINAVKAAEHSNSLALINAQIEQRAWLSFETPEVTKIWVVPGGFRGKSRALWIEYSIGLRNSGSTPALYVGCVGRITEDINSPEILELERSFREDQVRGGYPIAPGTTHIARLNGTFDFDPPPQGTKHTISLYAYVIVRYLTVGPKNEWGLTSQSYFVHQLQSGGIHGATLMGLDAEDIANGTASIHFHTVIGTMT